MSDQQMDELDHGRHHHHQALHIVDNLVSSNQSPSSVDKQWSADTDKRGPEGKGIVTTIDIDESTLSYTPKGPTTCSIRPILRASKGPMFKVNCVTWYRKQLVLQHIRRMGIRSRLRLAPLRIVTNAKAPGLGSKCLAWYSKQQLLHNIRRLGLRNRVGREQDVYLRPSLLDKVKYSPQHRTSVRTEQGALSTEGERSNFTPTNVSNRQLDGSSSHTAASSSYTSSDATDANSSTCSLDIEDPSTNIDPETEQPGPDQDSVSGSDSPSTQSQEARSTSNVRKSILNPIARWFKFGGLNNTRERSKLTVAEGSESDITASIDSSLDKRKRTERKSDFPWFSVSSAARKSLNQSTTHGDRTDVDLEADLGLSPPESKKTKWYEREAEEAPEKDIRMQMVFFQDTNRVMTQTTIMYLCTVVE